MSEVGLSVGGADVTDDKFLGGRLKLLQPRAGYRAGIDAVMLAATVPARPAERVFEAGIGFAAAALCLAARVPDVTVTGIEIDEAAAALAVENALRNGFADRIRIIGADVSAPGKALRQAGLAPASFDHAYANPPFHEASRVRAPSDSSRARAQLHGPDEMDAWARILVSAVKPGGTVSLILPAARIGEVFALFARRLGGIGIFPLFPRSEVAASRIIVQGIKGSRAAPLLLPGLVLHRDDGGFTDGAEAVLRHGAALPLNEKLSGDGELPVPAAAPKYRP
jgi:tRNA1(Val) A37 N6-methylase TrmN6